MRIAPVGLAYRHADDDTLRLTVTDALVCTQVHPEAVDAAAVQARAIGLTSLASITDALDCGNASALNTTDILSQVG